MTQMDPETSKNQIGMLKTFQIIDSKPNWEKKIFPYQKCIIHLCRSFLNIKKGKKLYFNLYIQEKSFLGWSTECLKAHSSKMAPNMYGYFFLFEESGTRKRWLSFVILVILVNLEILDALSWSSFFYAFTQQPPSDLSRRLL